MLFKEWQHPVIEDISGSNSMLSLIEFAKSYPAVGVDKGLLANATNCSHTQK